MALTMPGFRICMDLIAEGKPISRSQYWSHQPQIITDHKLGYDIEWRIPDASHAAMDYRVNLGAICLIDQHWLWGLLGICTMDGMPICWRQPWQAYIHQDDQGRKVPGAVDRLIPGIWLGETMQSAVQTPLTCVSYVIGKPASTKD